jgi:hypothetical protein
MLSVEGLNGKSRVALVQSFSICLCLDWSQSQ